MISIFLVLFRSSSLTQSLVLIADTLFVSFFGYIAMAMMLVSYGLPALWFAIRFRFAGPTTALLVAALPGLCFLAIDGDRSSMDWLPLAISVATGIVFVALAYRITPSTSSFEPNPLSGPA